jgi:hypothetical protein
MTHFSLPSPDLCAESESKERPYENVKESSSTSVNCIRQLHISPMFHVFETKANGTDASASEDTNSISDLNHFRGATVADTIDPIDGKTKTCNRTKTFDAFLHEQHLGEDQPQKRTGYISEVARVVAKLRIPFKKSSGKSSKQQNS